MRSLARALPWAVALTFVLGGCGVDDSTERGAQASLDSGFLDSLDHAGVGYDVIVACHYLRTDGEPWHFAVHITIDADMATATSALAPGVDIIDDRRPTAVVQQYSGQPQKGWSGRLTDNGDTTALHLVKNNIDISDGGRPGVGWLPVCAETLPT